MVTTMVAGPRRRGAAAAATTTTMGTTSMLPFLSILLLVVCPSNAFVGPTPSRVLQTTGRTSDSFSSVFHVNHGSPRTAQQPRSRSSPPSSASTMSQVRLFESKNIVQHFFRPVQDNPARSIKFSVLMTICGAMLGPFLDSYHSAFGVLQYDDPIMIQLWGTAAKPALTTAWWVPELFGLAGFLIGWLYILLDAKLETPDDPLLRPSPPKILYCISFFTLQYWLSGILYGLVHLDRGLIGTAMQLLAIAGFFGFDRTRSGVVTSLATAIGGPLIEVLLISTLQGHGGYHYTDPGETGFFPLWIAYGKSKHGQRRNEKERERGWGGGVLPMNFLWRTRLSS